MFYDIFCSEKPLQQRHFCRNGLSKQFFVVTAIRFVFFGRNGFSKQFFVVTAVRNFFGRNGFSEKIVVVTAFRKKLLS